MVKTHPCCFLFFSLPGSNKLPPMNRMMNEIAKQKKRLLKKYEILYIILKAVVSTFCLSASVN